MFQIGDEVRIETSHYSSRRDLVGLTGIIEHTCVASGDIRFGVRVPGKHNNQSGFGVWWFSGDELNHCTENKIIEEEKFMLPGYRIAMIHFIQGENTDRTYPYALYPEDNCSSGDMVVVSTGHHGFAVAQIDSIEPNITDKEVKCGRQIVGRCDFHNFDTRRTDETRAADLKKAMDKRAEELRDTALYQALAEKDPGMAAMLGEYTSLMKLGGNYGTETEY